MLLLTSTTDKIQIVTSAANAAIDVHCSWVDNNNRVITPGRLNTVNINTATTTDVVPSPAIDVQRNVKGIYISNNSLSVTTNITVIHTDGTNFADIMSVTLMPGENLNMREDGSWVHRDSNGAEYGQTSPVDPWVVYGITGTVAESMPRMLCSEANLSALTSGTLTMQAIYLKAGQKISSISFSSATTAASVPTSCIFGLYDGNRNKVAETNNATTTAWAANTVRTLSLTSQFTVPTSGIYYVGILVVATTSVPTLKGLAAKSASQLAGVAPILHGTSTAALTNTLPATAAAITAGVNALWCALT